MPRCPNQSHIRGRPPTHIVHRIRWHRSITPRTRAPGPKLLTTRANRWDIARMSTRTSGGPSGVSGLLDHETQIRPRAQKNYPHRGKGGGRASFHDRNGAARTTRPVKTAGVPISSVSRKAHTLLLWSLSRASRPSDPYSRAVMCHLYCLLACLLRKTLLRERESIKTATGRLPRVVPAAGALTAVVGFGRASPWPLVWRQRCSARRRLESVGHPPGRRPASGTEDVLSKRGRLSRR
jgi:hypothetical protein